MYIEIKTNGLHGTGRIGRVTFSKAFKTIYYQNRILVKARGIPLKANYYDVKTLQDFWISGPSKEGGDALFPARIEIDEDVRLEYWQDIRKLPEHIELTSYKSPGKSKSERQKAEKALRRRQMDNGWAPV